MKTAASSADIAAERGWINPETMVFEHYLDAADLWYRIYGARDWNHHFRAATRELHPNKISVQRMEDFSNAYALAKLRGEI